MEKVKIFFEEEVKELVYQEEELKEWHSKIEEMGLKGQAKISHDKNSPIPFLYMNSVLVETFRSLCEREESIDTYSKSTIPLEVVQAIALCKKEGYFSRVLIRYADKDPDPVVIGEIGYWYELQYYGSSNKNLEGEKFPTKEEGINKGAKNISFVTEDRYLIARWGAENLPLQDLTVLAKKKYIATQSNEAKKKIKQGKRELEDVEISAFEKFGI